MSSRTTTTHTTNPMAELHGLHVQLHQVNEILKGYVLRPCDGSATLAFVKSENERLAQAIAEAGSRIGRDEVRGAL